MADACQHVASLKDMSQHPFPPSRRGSFAEVDVNRLVSPLAAVALLAAATTAAAAPSSDGRDAFGIAMGAPIGKIAGARAFKPGWYRLAAPPRPDPRFDKVAVEAFARTGVCVVQAVGAEITDDPTGAKIRAAMDRLADDFSATYGQPQKLDLCKGGPCVPDLWGEDLQTGERRYGYRWTMHDAPAKGVREVSIVAVAHSVSRFVYLAQFDSGALTACAAGEGAAR